MSAVDSYLGELEAALRVRGERRRRFLAECRDHLADAAAVAGADEAVRRFGPALDVARAFEVEVAVQRARAATVLTTGGVLGIALSTLALIHAADGGLAAPVAWAVVFFVSAQTSAVATALALLRAAAMRDEVGTPADVALLCRRGRVALAFAALTMLASGAGVPGQTDAWRLLAGPALGLLAALALARASHLARRHRDDADASVRSPVADLAAVARRTAAAVPQWTPRPALLLPPTAVLGAVGAFWWSYLDDHGTAGGALAAAVVEATCVVLGFVALGRPLGLYARRQPR
ncbi:hypothetical protein GCM10028801_17320 [Nocardioides maradonensis]